MFWRIIGGIFQLAVVAYLLFRPDDGESVLAISPLIPIISGAALQAFSGKDKPGQMPQWVIDLIKGSVLQDRTTGYLPDEATYNAQTQAQIDEILAGIPVGTESFNSQAAARGVFRGGESLKNLYSTVYAPITRAATSAAVEGQVNYQNLALKAKTEAERQKLQALQLLIQSINPEGGQTSNLQDLLGGLGQGLSQFGGFQLELDQLRKYGLIKTDQPQGYGLI